MQPTNSLKPNEVLSPIMHVKPLAPNEVVIYRLITADQISSNRQTEDGVKLPNKPARSLSGKTLVRDIEKGTRVMIGHVTSVVPKQDAQGNIIYMQRTEAVNFPNATARLTADDFDKYAYMERHDGNADNPYRDKRKAAFFYRVNPRKKASEAIMQLSMKGVALAWVGEADNKELRSINEALPAGLKVDMNKSYEEIKQELLQLTDRNPIEVMKASSNREAKTKITVWDCEFLNIIMWSEELRKWYFNDESQEDILEVPIGSNRVDALVYFFMTTEGTKIRNRVSTKLKKFLNQGKSE